MNLPNAPLQIMQYNVAKKREVMDSILNDKDTQKYSLFLLQEPCRTYKQKIPLLHQSWTAIEPTHLTETPPRVAIYFNNKKISPSSIEQIAIPHPDIIAVSLPPQLPFLKPTLIVNLYNDTHTYSAMEQLRHILFRHLKIEDYEVILVAGDFNLHHALWNRVGYTAQEPQAQTLVETMMEANLRPLLPPGMVTFPSRSDGTQPTSIDLVWSNESAEDIVIKCHTVEGTNDHGSDHYPIEIVLDLSPKKLPPIVPPYNYDKTNWDLVKIELQCLLPPAINSNNTSP